MNRDNSQMPLRNTLLQRGFSYGSAKKVSFFLAAKRAEALMSNSFFKI